MCPLPAAARRCSSLTESCQREKAFCMRITLDLDARVVKDARRLALEHGKTLAQLINEAICRHLADPAQLPPFRLALLIKQGDAQPGVDWDSRDSIYEHMEGRS